VLVLLVGAALTVALPSAAHAADADLVAVGAPTAVQLPAVESAVARFPVQATAPARPLTATVLSVVAGSVEAVDPDAVTATYDTVSPAVVLTVRTDAFVRVGRYDVAVLLTDAASGTQVVTLPLERATAELTVPPSVTWRRTTEMCVAQWCLAELPWLGTPDDQPPLVVTTGATSRVVDLRARDPQGETPRITVSVPDDGLPLGPDDQLTLDYAATGGEPGSVTRQATLVSDQVTGAVPVSFTVVTARPDSLIALVLLVGVGLSWLLRSALPLLSRQVALLRRRSDLARWLDELDELYPDATLRAATAAARRNVDRASDAALTTITTDITASVTTLETSLRVLTVEHDTLVHAARTRPGLEAAEPALVEVRAHAADALAHLGRCDAGKARTALAAGVSRLRALAANPPQTVLLTDLATALAGRTEGAVGELLTAVGSVQPTAPPDVTATVTALGEHLDTLAITPRSPALRAAVLKVADEADAVVTGLKQAAQPAQAPALTTAAAALRADQDRGVVDALRALLTAYDDLADTRQLDDDARAKAARGDVLGAFVPAHLRFGAAGTPAPAASGTGAPDDTERATTPAPALRPPGLPSRGVIAAAALALGILQVVVAAFVVLVTGYALFLPDWIGTDAEIGQVAVWAFAVDTSLAGLVVLVTRAAPTTAAAPAAAPQVLTGG
jgi:hypothetical protein